MFGYPTFQHRMALPKNGAPPAVMIGSAPSRIATTKTVIAFVAYYQTVRFGKGIRQIKQLV
jgi:hypothetical protein